MSPFKKQTPLIKQRKSLHGLFVVKKKKEKVKNNNSEILCNCISAESRIRMIDVIYPVKNYE